jgi:hypothetical protein
MTVRQSREAGLKLQLMTVRQSREAGLKLGLTDVMSSTITVQYQDSNWYTAGNIFSLSNAISYEYRIHRCSQEN